MLFRSEILVPKVDWQKELQEFMVNSMRGDDEITFRRYDRRYVCDEIYMPTTYSDRVGTLLLLMDTSGSTVGKPFNTFCGGLKSIIERVKPERIRVLHWDTSVKSDQVLDEQEYTTTDISEFLKPRGGGGTCVTACGDYVVSNQINADCCVVFTDGYLESDIQWRPRIPTMWMITDNESFTPPSGRMLTISK